MELTEKFAAELKALFAQIERDLRVAGLDEKADSWNRASVSISNHLELFKIVNG